MTTPPTNRPMTGEDVKLMIARTIIEDLRAQHPGIEQVDHWRGDVWLPGGSTPQSSGCIIDVHSIAQSVEQQVRATLTPGHTDLMISPEAIDAFMEANPLPEPERDRAVERVRRMVGGECDATVYEGHSKTRLEAFDADLRHVLSLLETAERQRDEAVRALEEIAELEPKPFEGGLDMEAIRACKECKSYEGHPIQHGICNTHRRPIWDREAHEGHEEKALGYRAKAIARQALQSIGSDR